MKYRIMTVLVLCVLLFGLPLLGENSTTASNEEKEKKTEAESAVAEEAQPDPSTFSLNPVFFYGGYLSIGGRFSNLDESQLRLAEREAIRQGTRPTGRFAVWGFQNGVGYELEGSRGVDPTDQDYLADFDIKRIWKSHVSFTRLPHRLINDPLTNLDAGKGNVIVRHDSPDDGIEYCPYYQEFEWQNRITIPARVNVNLRFDYRNQGRKGSFQSATMSKCANCHVVSDVRLMDRETEDFVMGVGFASKNAGIDYQFLNRNLQEKQAAPLTVLDEARHPASLLRVFTNRVQFDSNAGPLPFAEIPEFKKNQHKLEGFVRLPGRGGRITGKVVDSRLQNSTVGFGVNSTLLSGHYGVYVGKRLSLSLQARNIDIDSDQIFVDVIEPVADFGPQTGKTYTEAYPSYGEVDFIQRSTLAREQFDFQFDGRLRLPGRSSLRFGYEFEDLDRPFSHVSSTQGHRFKLGFNTRAERTLRTRVRYEFGHFKDPFLNHNAALPPALQPFPSPGTPPSPFTGLQYFTMYRARMADLTNYPEQGHEFRWTTTWSPSDRFALTGGLRAEKLSHDDLNDFGDWSESSISPSVDLWFKPNRRFDLMTSYSYHHRHAETLFGIPVFDG